MKTFTDNAGRDWVIEINVASLKRVKGLTGTDLIALAVPDGVAPGRRNPNVEDQSDQAMVHASPRRETRHDLLARVAALGRRDRGVEPGFGGQHVVVEFGVEPRQPLFDAENF